MTRDIALIGALVKESLGSIEHLAAVSIDGYTTAAVEYHKLLIQDVGMPAQSRG